MKVPQFVVQVVPVVPDGCHAAKVPVGVRLAARAGRHIMFGQVLAVGDAEGVRWTLPPACGG